MSQSVARYFLIGLCFINLSTIDGDCDMDTMFRLCIYIYYVVYVFIYVLLYIYIIVYII